MASSVPITANSAPFLVTDSTFRCAHGDERCMVVTPRQHMNFNRERLERLRHSTGLSPAEYWLIDQVRKRGQGARIVVFRAVNDDGKRLWTFGEDVPEADFAEGGLVFTRALLPLHRRMFAAGALLMIHTDWGGHTCYAMRHGIRMLLSSVQAGSDPDTIKAVDSWVLRHMLAHVALSFDHVKRSLLPDYHAMLERRRKHALELLDQLPVSAVN